MSKEPETFVTSFQCQKSTEQGRKDERAEGRRLLDSARGFLTQGNEVSSQLLNVATLVLAV